MNDLQRLVLKDPLVLRPWLELLRAIGDQPSSTVDTWNTLNETYERCLAHMPLSYKIWKMYLEARVEQAAALKLKDLHFIADLFERALGFLPKMPNLWLQYAAFCASQGWITRTRVVHEKAISALPPTQHRRVWTSFKRFLADGGDKPINLVVPIMRRYLMFDTSFAAQVEYIGFLADRNCAGEVLHHAATVLVKRYRDDIADASGFWTIIAMCLGSLDPEDPESNRISSADAVELVDVGVVEHPAGATALRTSLAALLAARGAFIEARKVLQQSIDSARSTPDFFDALTAITEFEYSLVAKVVEHASSTTAQPLVPSTLQLLFPGASSIDDALVQVQGLANDHQLLYNTAMLKAEPAFVAYWLKRAELTNEAMHRTQASAADRVRAVAEVYEQAVAACCQDSGVALGGADGEADDEQQHGHGGGARSAASATEEDERTSFRFGLPVHSPREIFVAWSGFLEAEGSVDASLAVLERGALEGTFPSLMDNEALFCLFIERVVELRRPFESFRGVLVRATTIPPPKRKRKELFSRSACQRELWRCEGVWKIAMDVVAARGTIDDVLQLMTRMTTCKMLTPNAAIDFARVIAGERFNNSQQAYRRLEAAIDAFVTPTTATLASVAAAAALYSEYISLMVAEECPARIERCREVCDDALRCIKEQLDAFLDARGGRCSVKVLLDCFALFGLYIDAELEFGFFQNAVSIAQRAVQQFAPTRIAPLVEDRHLEIVERVLGASAASSVALQILDPLVRRRQTLATRRRVAQLAVRISTLEERLDRVTRAREVLTQVSALLPPTEAAFDAFWGHWEGLEIRKGSARTFKEMETIKKSAMQRATGATSTTVAAAQPLTARERQELAAAQRSEAQQRLRQAAASGVSET